MEKLLSGGAGYLFVLAGLVVVVTVGVMSILLPILVFRLLSEVSKMNAAMNTIITSLNETAKASRELQSRHQSEVSRSGSVSANTGMRDIGERSLRFK